MASLDLFYTEFFFQIETQEFLFKMIVKERLRWLLQTYYGPDRTENLKSIQQYELHCAWCALMLPKLGTFVAGA